MSEFGGLKRTFVSAALKYQPSADCSGDYFM